MRSIRITSSPINFQDNISLWLSRTLFHSEPIKTLKYNTTEAIFQSFPRVMWCNRKRRGITHCFNKAVRFHTIFMGLGYMHRDNVEWAMQKSKPLLAPELYSPYKAYKTKESISKRSLYHHGKKILKNMTWKKEITL